MIIKTYDYMGEKNNIVEMEQVLHHLTTPIFENNSNKKYEVICVKIKTKIYTDREFVKEEVAECQAIDSYYIDERRYAGAVDTLIQKRVYIKNANFIIKVTIGKEWLNAGRVSGWFDVIKNAEIFLNNKKDKKALKEARKTIESIKRTANFDSVFDVLFTKNNSNNELKYNEVNDNVYQLIRKI